MVLSLFPQANSGLFYSLGQTVNFLEVRNVKYSSLYISV